MSRKKQTLFHHCLILNSQYCTGKYKKSRCIKTCLLVEPSCYSVFLIGLSFHAKNLRLLKLWKNSLIFCKLSENILKVEILSYYILTFQSGSLATKLSHSLLRHLNLCFSYRLGADRGKLLCPSWRIYCSQSWPDSTYQWWSGGQNAVLQGKTYACKEKMCSRSSWSLSY